MKYYYGNIEGDWGFVDEKDSRRKLPNMIELSEIEYHNLLDKQTEGLEIVHYEGKVFNAEPGRYYVDSNGIWQKRTDIEIDAERRKAINLISLTKREVFLALYYAKGITPEVVRGSILDPAALIEFDYATEYFRGNPLIDAIGAQLGYTTDDLDYLFLNKELPKSEVQNDG